MGISTEFNLGRHTVVAPLSNPWLDWAITLDARSSGFLASLTCATGARRHAVLAALARLRKEAPEALAAKLGDEFAPRQADPLLRIAVSLRSMSPRTVFERLYGSAPDGYCGFLDRLGPEPLKPGLYRTWQRLFEQESPRARVLTQVSGPITDGMWWTALSLDEVALAPAIMARLSAKDVAVLNHGISVIRQSCSTTFDDELRSSLVSGVGPLDVGKWVQSTINRRMDTLPHGHPISSGDRDFQPLITGPDHTAAARQFRNCLSRDRTLLVAVGKVTYAVYRCHPVVIEFRRLTTAPWWIASDGYGPRNYNVGPEIMDEIVATLAARRIPFLAALNQQDEVLAQKAGSVDFGPACLREVTTTNKPHEAAA